MYLLTLEEKKNSNRKVNEFPAFNAVNWFFRCAFDPCSSITVSKLSEFHVKVFQSYEIIPKKKQTLSCTIINNSRNRRNWFGLFLFKNRYWTGFFRFQHGTNFLVIYLYPFILQLSVTFNVYELYQLSPSESIQHVRSDEDNDDDDDEGNVTLLSRHMKMGFLWSLQTEHELCMFHAVDQCSICCGSMCVLHSTASVQLMWIFSLNWILLKIDGISRWKCQYLLSIK